jgi:preprotein translocase subunit SecF
MFDVIGKRRIFYALSLALTIPGLVFILLTPFTDLGLQFTIDYTGGTRWELRFEDPEVTPEQVVAVFEANGLDATAVSTSTGFIEIKTEPIGLQPAPVPTEAPSASPGASGSPGASASPAASASASPDPSASVSPSASPSAIPGAAGNTELPTEGRLAEMVTALEAELGPIEAQASLTTIGPVVSSDLIGQALILILVGSLGIVAWITYRFRDVKFGATALVSLLHDVIVVVGAFAILGTFFHVEIDALFVTAMLTVIGFSVHDTIVVFDRIRENQARHIGEPFDEIVNHSILQTFGRSITTSLTVLITLLSLFLFGGAAITDFVLTLLIGIIIGTYSSIFVASPLLVDWQRWEDRRHGRLTTTRAPRPRRATS